MEVMANTLSPVSHSDASQLWMSVSSCIRKRSVSTFLRVCITGHQSENLSLLASYGLEKENVGAKKQIQSGLNRWLHVDLACKKTS